MPSHQSATSDLPRLSCEFLASEESMFPLLTDITVSLIRPDSWNMTLNTTSYAASCMQMGESFGGGAHARWLGILDKTGWSDVKLRRVRFRLAHSAPRSLMQ